MCPYSQISLSGEHLIPAPKTGIQMTADSSFWVHTWYGCCAGAASAGSRACCCADDCCGWHGGGHGTGCGLLMLLLWRRRLLRLRQGLRRSLFPGNKLLAVLLPELQHLDDLARILVEAFLCQCEMKVSCYSCSPHAIFRMMWCCC